MAGRWSWLALGVSAYFAFTIAAFPATAAYEWFAPPEVSVTGIEGTLWSGSAASAAVGGIAVQELRWRVRPWPLLVGRIAANVQGRFADGFVSTNVTASPSFVRFTDLRGGTSLPSLASVLPVRGIRGQASVQLATLEIADGWPARLVGELRIAGLEAPPFVPNGSQQLVTLGDYTVTFVDAAGRGLEATFVDDGGPLEVTDGRLSVDTARNYTLDALIEPRAGADEQLIEGLNFMTADPDAEGRRRLTLTGSL